MTRRAKSTTLCIATIILIVIIDQLIKFEVKTNMFLRESIYVADWFQIFFIENDGIAWGLQIMPQLFLTLFRLIAVGLIGYMIHQSVKHEAKTGFLICLSLIFAGAAGNIIDNVFYGAIYTESTPFTKATLTAVGQGYGGWMHGKVVDMFYFPIIDTYWPEWMPFVGGEHFIFFSPVFNFADASISCGVIALLLFYGKYLNHLLNGKKGD